MTTEFYVAAGIAALLLWLLVIAIRTREKATADLAAFKKEFQNRVNEAVVKEFAVWKQKDGDAVLADAKAIAEADARHRLEVWMQQNSSSIRADAISRSRATITGQIAEHLLPFYESFPYNPKDTRFLGSPIDLIVFDGLSNEMVAQIVFIEVKTGENRRLSARQQQIRDAIKRGKVIWREIDASKPG